MPPPLGDIPGRPFAGRVSPGQVVVAEAEVAKCFVSGGFEIADELHVASLFRTGRGIYTNLAVKFDTPLGSVVALGL